jgi:hypothetical protein
MNTVNTVASTFVRAINEAEIEKVPLVVERIIQQLHALGEKSGHDQSMILIVRQAATERGIDGRLFQSLLEETKCDNIPLG